MEEPTQQDDTRTRLPNETGYALTREDSGDWARLERARREAEDASIIYETIKEQIIYAALKKGLSVRDTAEALGISKSEVGRIARIVRDRPETAPVTPVVKGRSRQEEPPDLMRIRTNERLRHLNELWNGPSAEPLALTEARPLGPDLLGAIHDRERASD